MKQWLLCICAGLLVASGCEGPKTPQPVPVRGTVRWKGEPLSVGRIQFVPENPTVGRPASGDLNEEGAYRLSTFETNDGAIPGKYAVQIFPFDYNAEVTAKVHTDVPARYQDPITSGLAAEVADKWGNQTFDFDLVE